MNKILLGLGALVALLNPLTGVYAQAFFNAGWDFLIINGGWIATGAFAVFVIFYIGFLFAKMTLNDQKKQNKGIAKAKKSNVSKKDGMRYEIA